MQIRLFFLLTLNLLFFTFFSIKTLLCNLNYMNNFKNFIIGFFGDFPCCTGLLIYLIGCHITGIKTFTAPWGNAPKIFRIGAYAYIAIALGFILLFLTNIEFEKRKRITWIVILSSSIAMIIIAIFFAP